MECFELMQSNRSPEAMVVALSIVCSMFHQVWNTINLKRFEGKSRHWKTCVFNIMSRVKLVGDTTGASSNNSIYSFSILKGFNVIVHPRRPLSIFEVLWSPPPKG